MSGTVTVPGVGNTTLSLSFVGSANLGLAHQISNALAQAASGSTLDVVNYTGGPLPVVPPGDTTLELVLASNVSGSITVPAAASGVAEFLVVNNTQALTIHGSSSVSIVGGGPGNLTIDDPNVVDIGANIGATGTVSMTFSSADSPYQVAMGQGFETVNANGSGTITGGTGPDVVNVTGPNDAIEAGSDGTTVNAVGFASSVDGSSGNLTVNDGGYLDTITAGATFATAVATSGFRASVLGGSGDSSTLTVTDTGLRNTIQGGAGETNVSLAGSFGRARGGTGNFSADAVTASNTIIGSTANTTNVTVGASASNTDVFGRAGNINIDDLGANALLGASGGASSVTIDGAGTQLYGASPAGAPTGTLNVTIGAASVDAFALGDNTTVDASSAAATGALVFGGFSSIAADNGTLSIQGGADSLVAVTGGSNSTINAGSGNTFVFIGTGAALNPVAGSNLIHGGSGILDVTFIGGAGTATVFGGEASTSLFGADGTNATFFGNSVGGYLVAAGTSVGGETINAGGSSTNDTLNAAAGNVSLVAGSGNDFLFAGVNTGTLPGGLNATVTGGDTLTGSTSGTATDTMIFTHGVWTGAAVVTNFSTNDTYLLSGYGSTAAGAALAASTFNGGDTTIALADGTHITFTDATAAQLAGHLIST
jgi:hypothetical protein